MVKIAFKTLSRQKFELDLELDATVETMKQRLHTEMGYPLTAVLVFAGQALKDNTATLASIGVGANKPIIIAANPVAKSKPATQTEPTTSEAAPATEKPTDEPPKAPEATPAPTAAPSGAAATPGSAPAVTAPEPNGEVLAQLMAMTGADADKVKRALALAQNNPDVAAELLFSGQPLPDPVALDTAQAGAEGVGSASDALPSGVTAEQMELVQILRQPQFVQMRAEVVANSEQLEPLLEQLGTAKPEILRLINNNQELFLEYLYSGTDQGGAGGRQVVQVTPEEKAAIERLEQMGFSRDMVLQAYFACEKDENLAADFLLSQPSDDW